MSNNKDKKVKFILKEYIDKHNISMNLLSQQTGIRYGTIFNIMHAKHDKIDMVHLQKILEVLSIKDMNIVFEKSQ